MEVANPASYVEQSLKIEENKRRKREGIVILVTALMVAALIFFEVQLPDVAPEYSLGSNIKVAIDGASTKVATCNSGSC